MYISYESSVTLILFSKSSISYLISVVLISANLVTITVNAEIKVIGSLIICESKRSIDNRAAFSSNGRHSLGSDRSIDIAYTVVAPVYTSCMVLIWRGRTHYENRPTISA